MQTVTEIKAGEGIYDLPVSILDAITPLELIDKCTVVALEDILKLILKKDLTRHIYFKIEGASGYVSAYLANKNSLIGQEAAEYLIFNGYPHPAEDCLKLAKKRLTNLIK